MIFIRIWILLVFIIIILSLFSAKGRAYFRLLKNFYLERPVFLSIPLLGLIGITSLFFFLGRPTSALSFNIEDQKIIQDSLIGYFTKEQIIEALKIDITKTVPLEKGKPELTYILPTAINTFKSITKKEKMPVLFQSDSISLTLKAEGFGLFKNRGHRIKKALQKKLGNDYIVQFHAPNEIKIQYKGPPWNAELKLSLPILRVAIHEQVEPALLMSLVKNNHGFIPLDTIPTLERFTPIAIDLKQRLTDHSSMEDALASIYFNAPTPQALPIKWWRQPTASNWVQQVFIDAQIYRDYGFSLDLP